MKPVLFSFELPVLGKVVFPAYFTFLTVAFALASPAPDDLYQDVYSRPLNLYRGAP